MFKFFKEFWLGLTYPARVRPPPATGWENFLNGKNDLNEPNLQKFLVRIHDAPEDVSKCKVIIEELERDSPLVKQLKFLFVTKRAPFLGYNFEPLVPKTWLPIEGERVPSSLSKAAAQYLLKHLAVLTDRDRADHHANAHLFDWLIQVISFNYKIDPSHEAVHDFYNNPQKLSAMVQAFLTQAS